MRPNWSAKEILKWSSATIQELDIKTLNHLSSQETNCVISLILIKYGSSLNNYPRLCNCRTLYEWATPRRATLRRLMESLCTTLPIHTNALPARSRTTTWNLRCRSDILLATKLAPSECSKSSMGKQNFAAAALRTLVRRTNLPGNKSTRSSMRITNTLLQATSWRKYVDQGCSSRKIEREILPKMICILSLEFLNVIY